jgi:hypothetical protein
MNLAEIYRAVTRLLDTGWTIPEIERLSQFRSRFQQTKDDLPDFNFDIRHLEFIRWLIQTGRLLDW